MAFAGAVSFQSCGRHVNKLFRHLSRDPPPGKSRVSQILAADKQVFVRLIEAGVRLKRDPDKSFPLDSALMAALEYEVGFLLLHEPANKPPKRPIRLESLMLPLSARGQAKAQARASRSTPVLVRRPDS